MLAGLYFSIKGGVSTNKAEGCFPMGNKMGKAGFLSRILLLGNGAWIWYEVGVVTRAKVCFSLDNGVFIEGGVTIKAKACLE